MFDREILPLIQTVPLSELVRATGLSHGYLSQIRHGRKTPRSRGTGMRFARLFEVPQLDPQPEDEAVKREWGFGAGPRCLPRWSANDVGAITA